MRGFDNVTGDFTILKYVKDLSRDEIEDKVGFERGRLDQGAIIIVLDYPSEKVSPDDFEFGASSRWSRSSAAAPWAPQYAISPEHKMASNAIESALAERGQDVAALKQKVADFFNLGGDNRPAKVLPRRHEYGDEYPDAIGAGVPQFKFKTGKRFVEFRKILGRSGAV